MGTWLLCLKKTVFKFKNHYNNFLSGSSIGLMMTHIITNKKMTLANIWVRNLEWRRLHISLCWMQLHIRLEIWIYSFLKYGIFTWFTEYLPGARHIYLLYGIFTCCTAYSPVVLHIHLLFGIFTCCTAYSPVARHIVEEKNFVPIYFKTTFVTIVFPTKIYIENIYLV